MRVIAIDPGYDRMGVAIIDRSPLRKDSLLFSDCLTTVKGDDFYVRLHSLGTTLEKLIAKWKPTHLAFERLFFAKNQKTAIAVAEVRGMIGYIAEKHGLTICEYTPVQIKSAVAGHGQADKRQVAQMVTALLQLAKKTRLDDEYDAIAIGLTCTASEQ